MAREKARVLTKAQGRLKGVGHSPQPPRFLHAYVGETPFHVAPVDDITPLAYVGTSTRLLVNLSNRHMKIDVAKRTMGLRIREAKNVTNPNAAKIGGSV